MIISKNSQTLQSSSSKILKNSKRDHSSTSSVKTTSNSNRNQSEKPSKSMDIGKD